MARISIDNGKTFDTVETTDYADEIFCELEHRTSLGFGSIWYDIVGLMEDDARKATHEQIADHCWSAEEFLIEYLKRAKADLIIG